MLGTWMAPDGMNRKSAVVSVSLGAFKTTDLSCPAANALKARGFASVRPAGRAKERLEDFTFAPLMRALDAERKDPAAAEFTSWGRPQHDGLREWTKHARTMYRNAFPLHEDEGLSDLPENWSYRYQPPKPDHRGAHEYRIKVWGRCLVSASGDLRELRVPVNRLREPRPDDGYIAAAALVLAEGAPGPLPTRVRVVEFALLDGATRVLFDGTRHEAVARYRAHGSQALEDILDSQEYRPGPACSSCAYISDCPALRRAPGVLGLPAKGRTRRTWSVTNGRSYRECPARDHMRRLHLPTADGIERHPSAERGRAVHAYLAWRHGSGAIRPCPADVPAQWVPDGYELPAEERELGRTLLRRHAAVCPMPYVVNRSDIRTEPRIVRHDSDADVIVIASPDLVYRDGDSWVWRETKTSATARRHLDDPLVTYPQLALAVALLSRGHLGGTAARARIELEVLSPGGADLRTIDPFSSRNVETAGKVLQELTTAWHVDSDYTPNPTANCTRCEVARWCTAGHRKNEAA
ncbi:PD-(D/E)XK nuclease family protein [Streptomyces sp. NPDC090025]|uniref:PD-(D/E)XK nuclease family protein n=1 Tax=Streptomyces sp. NPDC090025 TaxID=3365922 RepID=UPI00383578ED